MSSHSNLDLFWVSPIRPRKARSAKCSRPCSPSTRTNQVQQNCFNSHLWLHCWLLFLNVVYYHLWRFMKNGWKCLLQIYLSSVLFDSLALWIMAAKSELEDRNSSESARHLFLRALRFHPDNKKVYTEVEEAHFTCFTLKVIQSLVV